MHDKRTEINDEQLLESFFKEVKAASRPLADDGFTERVMAALPERQSSVAAENARLRHWSVGLNVVGIVAAILLLIRLGLFGRIQGAFETGLLHIIAALRAFDPDALLVHAMLFLRHLPDLLPTPSQLIILTIATVTISAMTISRRRTFFY